ncbi:hypothetical protein MTO96_027014 [Rhipicephalus appendiculatus]
MNIFAFVIQLTTGESSTARRQWEKTVREILGLGLFCNWKVEYVMYIAATKRGKPYVLPRTKATKATTTTATRATDTHTQTRADRDSHVSGEKRRRYSAPRTTSVPSGGQARRRRRTNGRRELRLQARRRGSFPCHESAAREANPSEAARPASSPQRSRARNAAAPFDSNAMRESPRSGGALSLLRSPPFPQFPRISPASLSSSHPYVPREKPGIGRDPVRRTKDLGRAPRAAAPPLVFLARGSRPGLLVADVTGERERSAPGKSNRVGRACVRGIAPERESVESVERKGCPGIHPFAVLGESCEPRPGHAPECGPGARKGEKKGCEKGGARGGPGITASCFSNP